jgi:hypothetical protein
MSPDFDTPDQVSGNRLIDIQVISQFLSKPPDPRYFTTEVVHNLAFLNTRNSRNTAAAPSIPTRRIAFRDETDIHSSTHFDNLPSKQTAEIEVPEPLFQHSPKLYYILIKCFTLAGTFSEFLLPLT